MKISYGILTHNEGLYILELLTVLKTYKGLEDEVIIVDDFSTDPKTIEVLDSFKDVPGFYIYQNKLNNDFSQQKNYLNSYCTGDYIVNIDADELVTTQFMTDIKDIIKESMVDLYLLPRINRVTGITSAHVDKWGWQLNKEGWVNYPDYQSRIYKNSPTIKWEGKVHEKITGFETYAPFPSDNYDYCILHYKDIERQEKQNTMYNSINN